MTDLSREQRTHLQGAAEQLSELVRSVKPDEATQRRLQSVLDAMIGERVVELPARRTLN